MAENLENVTVETPTEETETITMTKAELDALLQKNGDARVSQAMKTVEKKQKEAQKLAAMNASEKYEYELSQREAAIEEKERALALAENKNVASRILSEKGISLELVDFVVADDAESMDSKIKLLEKAFNKSVKTEIEKRLGSQVPKKNLADADAVTKDTLRKMTLAERQQFAKENPELYSNLR